MRIKIIVVDKTRAPFLREGESFYMLEERNDVDVYEDIRDVPVFQKFLD